MKSYNLEKVCTNANQKNTDLAKRDVNALKTARNSHRQLS